MAPFNPPQKPAGSELLAKAANVKLLVFDVDGVLTDGGLYYGPSGEGLKRIVEVRAKELGLVAAMQGRKDKALGLRELLDQLGTPAEACAYMGDDVNDLGALQIAGLPSCPADAAAEVRQQSLFVAQQPGGRGAVRELIELCLKASNRWNGALDLMRGGQI